MHKYEDYNEKVLKYKGKVSNLNIIRNILE